MTWPTRSDAATSAEAAALSYQDHQVLREVLRASCALAHSMPRGSRPWRGPDAGICALFAARSGK